MIIVVFIISRYGDSVNKKTQKPHIGHDISNPDFKLDPEYFDPIYFPKMQFHSLLTGMNDHQEGEPLL